MKITICDGCHKQLDSGVYKHFAVEGDFCGKECLPAMNVCEHDDRIDSTAHGDDVRSFICRACGVSFTEPFPAGVPA